VSIRILSDALVNKIAAGEVVERPASVVKELVENALDAGSKTVRVTLRGGGRALIRVTDDGHGMTRDDALLCLERHATSKIRSEDDLVKVRTLGFRGEALPSIAAVCRFTLTTRPRDADVGTEVRVEGGRMGGVKDAGCAPGTEIDCRSLFYNLPVRRKFLRTTATELGHCVEAVARQALVRPGVDFTVLHDGREVLRAPAAAGLGQRARAILGEEAGSLVPVEHAARGVEVTGLVAPPGLHRAGRTGSTYLYVNGRFVRDAVLRRALADAYRGLIPRGRHPVVVLEVRLAPEEVDVNVHPSKIEVRFRDPSGVGTTVSEAVRAALQAHGVQRVHRPVPAGLQRQVGDQVGLPLPAHPDEDPRLAGLEPLPADNAPRTAEPPPDRMGTPSRGYPPMWVADALEAAAAEEEAGTRVLGVVGGRWICCEAPDGGLAAVDGRAAREVVLRNRLAHEHAVGEGRPQRLLTPTLVDLARADAQTLETHRELLEGLHLDLAPLGPGEIAVRTVPASVVHLEIPTLLEELAAALGDEPSIEVVIETIAAHAADRGAVGESEARQLIAGLHALGEEVATARWTAAELAQRAR